MRTTNRVYTPAGLTRCDGNEDGSIDKVEFGLYYEKIAADMYKFHKGRASASTRKGPASVSPHGTP